MIANINGIQVVGTPEGIERYKQITTVDNKFGRPYKINDNVPEHVKNYGKHDTVYISSGKQVQAWF